MIAGLYKQFDKWSANGTVWLYSDPHFGDKELAAGIPNRPSPEEMVKLINSKVGRKDTLIILGDIGDIEYAKQLRGYKVLIAGNHDAGLSNYEDVFAEVYGGPLFISEKILLSHEPVDLPWAFNFHGHNHKGGANKYNQLNVCADVIGYVPLNLNQLVKQGVASRVESIHRDTIDKATERKRKRGGRKIHQ